MRSRHRREERHFEVIAGKVIDTDGSQHRFAFARNGQAASAEAFAQALSAAGGHAGAGLVAHRHGECPKAVQCCWVG